MFLPLFLLLLLVMPSSTFAGSIPPTFEQKLGSGKSPEFRLLGLLSYPDRTILLSDHSFSNKTALIEEVAAFADKESNLEPLRSQMTTKWTEAGGQAEQMANLMSSIQTVVDQARLKGVEKIRATMLALFALGEDLLDQMLVNKEELNGEADEKFAHGLKENLTKVQRALSGQDQNELMEVLDTELMDQTAGIGSKIDDKYADAMNDGQTVSLGPMLAGKPEAVKMVAQLVSHSVDKRLSEVAGVDGAWGFVKEDGGDGDAGNEVVAEGEEEGEEEDDGMEIGEDDEKDGQEEEEHEDAKLDKDATKEATGKDAKAAMAPVKLEDPKKQEPVAAAAVA